MKTQNDELNNLLNDLEVLKNNDFNFIENNEEIEIESLNFKSYEIIDLVEKYELNYDVEVNSSSNYKKLFL